MNEHTTKWALRVSLSEDMERIQRIISKLLLEQSNNILDCLEKKISILSVTDLIGCKSEDIDKLRERLRKSKKWLNT